MNRKEELLKELEAIEINDEYLDDAFYKLRKIALEIDADSLLLNYINHEGLENLLKLKLEMHDIWGVKKCLEEIDTLTPDIYYIKSHKVWNVDETDLEILKKDLRNELECWRNLKRKKEELLKEIEEINIESHNLDSAYFKFQKIAKRIGVEDLLSGFEFVSDIGLENLIHHNLEKYGASMVKSFLAGVKDFGHDVYLIDEYGNARNVNKDDLENVKALLKSKIGELEK